MTRPNDHLSLGPKGLALIKEFEGYHRKIDGGKCKAYLDQVGIPTIGWGSTRGIQLGMVWTKAEAEAQLLKDIALHEEVVRMQTLVPLNQHQFDALVSFDYNTGGLGRSTLKRLLNRGDLDAVPGQLRRWVFAGGKKFRGLVRRRDAEAALWNEPEETDWINEAAFIASNPKGETGPVKSVVTITKDSRTLKGGLMGLGGAGAALGAAAEMGRATKAAKDALDPTFALWSLVAENLWPATIIILCGTVGFMLWRRYRDVDEGLHV